MYQRCPLASLALLFSAAAAQAAPSLYLTLRYAGSTTAAPSSALMGDFVTAGNGFAQNPNLTIQNLSNPSYQTAEWKHYFDIGFIFAPLNFTSGYPDESLRKLLVDLSFTGNILPISPQGDTSAASQKYFPFALTSDTFARSPLFSTNLDSGIAGDLKAISVNLTSAAVSADAQLGHGSVGTINGGKSVIAPTYFGRFAVQFAGSFDASFISATASSGSNFSYFSNNNPFSASHDDNAYVSGNSGIIGSVIIPSDGSTTTPAKISYWKASTDASWQAAANWTNDIPTGGIYSYAVFDRLHALGPTNIALNGDGHTTALQFNNSNTYAITRGTGGTLYISSAPAGLGLSRESIIVLEGSHSIAAPVAFITNPASFSLTLSSRLTLSGNISGTQSLQVLGAGSLILSDNVVAPASLILTPSATLELDDSLIDCPSSIFGTLSGTGAFDEPVSTASSTRMRLTILDHNLSHHLIFNGSTALSGILELNLAPTYVPALHDTFDLFDFNGPRSGNFSLLLLPSLPNNFFWNTSSLYATGSVTILPEPSSLLLLSGLLVFRKNRRRPR